MIKRIKWWLRKLRGEDRYVVQFYVNAHWVELHSPTCLKYGGIPVSGGRYQFTKDNAEWCAFRWLHVNSVPTTVVRIY
jgi:hypothetical protein